jgi:hypothetical protein
MCYHTQHHNTFMRNPIMPRTSPDSRHDVALAALRIAVVMLGAIGFVHLAAGFWAPNGVEFPLMLFAGAASLALLGAGRFSLDALRGARRTAGGPDR